MGKHQNVGGGVTLLLAEKVHQFTCYWRTIHVMLGLQSPDHAKKRKENTGKRLEGNILFMTRHFVPVHVMHETSKEGILAHLVVGWRLR
jgi:hypothetical protein